MNELKASLKQYKNLYLDGDGEVIEGDFNSIVGLEKINKKISQHNQNIDPHSNFKNAGKLISSHGTFKGVKKKDKNIVPMYNAGAPIEEEK